jgi:hypothetical protein
LENDQEGGGNADRHQKMDRAIHECLRIEQKSLPVSFKP